LASALSAPAVDGEFFAAPGRRGDDGVSDAPRFALVPAFEGDVVSDAPLDTRAFFFGTSHTNCSSIGANAVKPSDSVSCELPLSVSIFRFFVERVRVRSPMGKLSFVTERVLIRLSCDSPVELGESTKLSFSSSKSS